VFAENLSSPLRSPYGGILGFCWLVKSFDELISESKERDIPLALPLWGYRYVSCYQPQSSR
jgi:hypothetical protein